MPRLPRSTIKIRRVYPRADGVIESSPVETPEEWWRAVLSDRQRAEIAERPRSKSGAPAGFYAHPSDHMLCYWVAELHDGDLADCRAACRTIEVAEIVLAYEIARGGTSLKIFCHDAPPAPGPTLFAICDVWTDDNLHIDFRVAATSNMGSIALVLRKAAEQYPGRIITTRQGTRVIERIG